MKTVKIYLNKEKTRFRIVKPTAHFNGNWDALVYDVTNGNFHSFKVYK